MDSSTYSQTVGDDGQSEKEHRIAPYNAAKKKKTLTRWKETGRAATGLESRGTAVEKSGRNQRPKSLSLPSKENEGKSRKPPALQRR